MARSITIFLAVIIITAVPATVAPAPVAAADSCTSASRKHPPKTIRVFRIHRKGSRVPARVERWDFKRYVGMVMRSGAWPNRVWASAKVGAVAIKQWAWWMILNHQPGYSWRGRCYDVRDSDQYLRPEVRPWTYLSPRTARAVRETWGISLRKQGRFFRTGWTGGECRDGWRLCEDTTRRLALRGWGMRHIIRHLLEPVRIVG